MRIDYRILLDTNALAALCNESPLSRETLRQLRHRVKHREVTVVVGETLIAELSSLASKQPKIYTRQLRELRRLTRTRILERWQVRVSREARVRGLLRDRSAFRPRHVCRRLFQEARAGTQHVAELARSKERVIQLYSEHSKDSRARFAESDTLFTDARAKYREQLIGNPDGWIDRFVRDTIFARDGSDYGIAPEDAVRLRPREVPSARADVAYHLFRSVLVEVGNQRITGSDVLDNHIFADAPYADVFITDDQRLWRIIELAGATGIRMAKFEPWAKWFLRCWRRRRVTPERSLSTPQGRPSGAPAE